MLYANDPNWKYNHASAGFGSGIFWNTAIGYDSSKPLRKEKNAPKISERLAAWDPIAQKEVWNVPHNGLWNGGVLTTSAGLVFEGTSDGKFMAFDATDGKVLWEKDLGTGIIASPVSYQVDDTQYVSIAAGWGGAMGKQIKFTAQINPGTVYTFALNKNARMPVFPKAASKKLIEMPFTATTGQIQHGGLLFNQYCGTCHTDIGTGGGTIPDLGYTSEARHRMFKDILLKGLLSSNGMPDFSGRLSEQDVTDIQSYVLASAKNQLANQKNK
jgi:Glucose dehydrogenase